MVMRAKISGWWPFWRHGCGPAPFGGRPAFWGSPPKVLGSGGVADAVLRQLGQQLMRLLRPLLVLLLDLLDELGDVLVVGGVTEELVVNLRTLERVVLDRDEVVDDVAGSGAGHSAPSIGFSAYVVVMPATPVAKSLHVVSYPYRSLYA